jgi:hypothetical protein
MDSVITMTTTRAEPDAGAADGVLATVRLSGDRALTIRTIRRTDVTGLDALFEGLSNDDRYRRFFGYSHPGQKFLDQMARAEEEGGYRLVAVVSDAGDSLVAEAGYAMLPDGNADFAMTVADGWRGWLGPYLLDALVRAAAARHVPNLQADVLVENTRMLTLLASRGYVTLHRQSSEIRVAIAAAQPARIRQQNRSRRAL